MLISKNANCKLTENFGFWGTVGQNCWTGKKGLTAKNTCGMLVKQDAFQVFFLCYKKLRGHLHD